MTRPLSGAGSPSETGSASAPAPSRADGAPRDEGGVSVKFGDAAAVIARPGLTGRKRSLPAWAVVLMAALTFPWVVGCQVAWTSDLLEEKARLEMDITTMKRKLDEVKILEEEIERLRDTLQSRTKEFERLRDEHPEAWRRMQKLLEEQGDR